MNVCCPFGNIHNGNKRIFETSDEFFQERFLTSLQESCCSVVGSLGSDSMYERMVTFAAHTEPRVAHKTETQYQATWPAYRVSMFGRSKGIDTRMQRGRDAVHAER